MTTVSCHQWEIVLRPANCYETRKSLFGLFGQDLAKSWPELIRVHWSLVNTHMYVYVDRCYTCQVCGACVICCLATRSWVTQSMHNMQQQIIGRLASVVMFHPDIRYDVESRMEGNHILTGPTIGKNTTNYKLRTFQFNKKICWGVFLMYF